MIFIGTVLIAAVIFILTYILAYAWAGYRYSKDYLNAIAEAKKCADHFRELSDDLEKALAEVHNVR